MVNKSYVRLINAKGCWRLRNLIYSCYGAEGVKCFDNSEVEIVVAGANGDSMLKIRARKKVFPEAFAERGRIEGVRCLGNDVVVEENDLALITLFANNIGEIKFKVHYNPNDYSRFCDVHGRLRNRYSLENKKV